MTKDSYMYNDSFRVLDDLNITLDPSNLHFISNIKDTAYIVDTIKPVYNFKHSEVQAKKNYKTI